MLPQSLSNARAGPTSLLVTGFPSNDTYVKLAKPFKTSTSASSATLFCVSTSVCKLGKFLGRLSASVAMRFCAQRSVCKRGDVGKLLS